MGARSSSLAKLAKAARLSAEACRLYAEASEELSRQADNDVEEPAKVTDVDKARARRALLRVGARL